MCKYVIGFEINYTYYKFLLAKTNIKLLKLLSQFINMQHINGLFYLVIIINILHLTMRVNKLEIENKKPRH